MTKIAFAAAIAVASALPAAAQPNDPDVNKLPAGPMRQVVVEQCTTCHELGRIVNGNYNAAEWANNVHMMMNAGAGLTPNQVQPVIDYLVKSFPEKPGNPFKAVAGPVKVDIKEWELPVPGSRPHDPLAAPDGTMFYTAHMGSYIGHLDPKTSKFEVFKTKTPVSGPHGLTMDKEGNVWYTGNFKGYIGKLNPKTGQFTEYKTGAARDPHTPLFDKDGISGLPAKTATWSAVSTRRPARLSWRLCRPKRQRLTAWFLTPRASSGSANGRSRSWPGSTIRPWKSMRLRSRTKPRARAASRSMRTT
jgi:virginiamycin B lyase